MVRVLKFILFKRMEVVMSFKEFKLLMMYMKTFSRCIRVLKTPYLYTDEARNEADFERADAELFFEELAERRQNPEKDANRVYCAIKRAAFRVLEFSEPSEVDRLLKKEGVDWRDL